MCGQPSDSALFACHGQTKQKKAPPLRPPRIVVTRRDQLTPDCQLPCQKLHPGPTSLWLATPRAVMAPSFLNLKGLRRRSRASFRTDSNTDNSSNDDQQSHGTAPTTGSLTPPSLAAQSDIALHLQVKDSRQSSPSSQLRPPLQAAPNKRYSMAASINGGQSRPVTVSHYAPRITNVSENSWV